MASVKVEVVENVKVLLTFDEACELFTILHSAMGNATLDGIGLHPLCDGLREAGAFSVRTYNHVLNDETCWK